jgi:hypothetical protein
MCVLFLFSRHLSKVSGISRLFQGFEGNENMLLHRLVQVQDFGTLLWFPFIVQLMAFLTENLAILNLPGA